MDKINIKALRLELGLSYYRVAGDTGLSRATIANVEAGRCRLTSYEKLIAYYLKKKEEIK
jgi:Helix-turn-helix.